MTNMDELPSGSHSTPLTLEVARPCGPPEDLQELLGDAIPPVQAALRTLLELDRVKMIAFPERQLALFQELAAINLRRLGREQLSELIDNSTHTLTATATLIFRWPSSEDARNVASTFLLQPAPARAALLRLLAAMMCWQPGGQLPAASGVDDEQGQGQSAALEPGGQLPAASVGEKREGQPGTLHGSAVAPSIAWPREQPGDAPAAAERDGAELRQQQEVVGYEAGFVQGLNGLRHAVCWLVCQLLANDCDLRELVRSRTPRLLLCLDFGCSLLQAHVLHCLSRQLAAASGALVGQLSPEVAAVPQPMRGLVQQQRQHGGQGQQSGEGVPSPLPVPPAAAKGDASERAAAALREGVAGPVRAAEHAVMAASALVDPLHVLMSHAADACHSTGSSSSALAPSHGSQPRDVGGVKQLRQLSRRFLLLLTGGLRDSHVFDHWARAVLLAALCSAEEQGGEAVGGEREERAGSGSPTQGAGVTGSDRGDPSEGGVSGEAGQTAEAARGSQQQQQQRARGGAFGVKVYWGNVYEIGTVLTSLRKACGRGVATHSLPPGLCAALHQALSGPCTQHLTLALGTLMLHQADGGSLYGMPLPYSTGALAEALAMATQDLATSDSGEPLLQLIDAPLYRNLQRLLTNFGSCVPQPLPAVPPEGHLDLLLRMGCLAVRSAQAHKGQEGGMGRRVAVIRQGDVTGVALTSLVTARALLSTSAGKAPDSVGPARGAVGAAGEGQGMGGADAEGAGANTGQAAAGLSGCPAAAARLSARAAVAAETRWHRLLLDTGLWVEMEGTELAVWAQTWNHMESLGNVGEFTGALSPPARVAGALAAGVLPCLERVLRRAGEREASGGSVADDPPLLPGLFRCKCHWLATLGWLLAYGDVQQGASFIATLRKLVVQGHQQQQQRQQQQQHRRRQIQRNASDGNTAASSMAHDKALDLITYAVKLGQQAGAASIGGEDGDGGGGRARKHGGGGGSGFSAMPGGQVWATRNGASGMDSLGLPRLQLLLWYGVRQLMPPVVQVALGNETHMGTSWRKGVEVWAKAFTLVGNVLRPVAVLALQIASGSGGGSSARGVGKGASCSGRARGSSGARDTVSSVEGNDSGCSSSRAAEVGSVSSPPAWLGSWRRVLLEEWRVVELVGSALEQVVLALGPGEGGGVIASAQIETVQALMGAVCSVALAFPDRVWSAAGAPGAEAQAKERQAKGSQRGRGSSKGGGKRAASAAASVPAFVAPAVWVWPTGRVVQLLGAVRMHLGMGYARTLEPELDALSKLVDLVKAGGPELPYKYDMPFVQATLKLKTNSTLVGGYRGGGEVPSPELLDGLLRTCSNPRCASLEGDSEVGAEGRLVACGRGCGRAWYCCQACAEAHWREGHAEACGGGAAAERQDVAGCSGSVG